ncbi:MAG: transcriptional regulator GcvA [Salinarimonas sp.]|nr:transcriptional regulator GcvA [Salinarimonas sp.]
MRSLPPLNALRAFEAAARHMSFSKAAEELNVTPAAISQQIRTLEDIAGVKLFRRLTRSLLLSDAGQVALPAVTEGLDQLAEGYRAMRRQEEAGVLTVSVAPSLGAKWLVPRLERFRDKHPEFDIRIDATDRVVDFQRGDVDLALRYGSGAYEGLTAHCLMSELAAPVCSPALLAGKHPLREPADLRHHTLLHSQWRLQHAFAPNWRMWLRATGLADIDPESGPRFSEDNLVVQAAIAGQGVALVGRAVAAADLRAGLLVHPFGTGSGESSGYCYYVVYPEGDAARPKVRAFTDWVLEEAEDSAAM